MKSIISQFVWVAVLIYGSLLVISSPTTEVEHNAINQKYYHYLMDNLDTSNSPCSQFYPYVCSKWPAKHKSNIDNNNSVQKLLSYEINMEIKAYLENQTPVKDMPEHVQMVKDFYVSCKENNNVSLVEFMQCYIRNNMKWALLTPIENKDDATIAFDWPSTMAIFRKYDFNDLLVEQWTDSKNSFNYVKKTDIRHLMKAINLPNGTMEFLDLWKRIDGFEYKFGEVVANSEEEEQTLKFKDIPYPWFKKYLKAVMGGAGAKVSDIDDNTEFRISSLSSMEDLDKLLKEYDEAFLCRYLEVRFLLYLEKINELDETDANKCVTLATGLLSLSAEWIYKELHPELLAEIPTIQQMFDNIVKNVNKTLQMDKDGRSIIPQQFFNKLDTMTVQVSHVPLENIQEFFETDYAKFKLNSHDFHGNYLQLLKFYYETEIKDNRNDTDIFYTTPTYSIMKLDLIPKYDEDMNRIILPFMLLRPPFYHLAFEDIFKQSSLATLLAEVIFYAFDTKDSGFNATDIDNLAEIISFHSTFQIFFQSLQTDDISRYLSLFNLTSLQQLKQLFFINAIHIRCEVDYADAEITNFILIQLSEFNDAFD
ncbi:membrane metallo-endopeptidase-like 1, partial [Musca vetustissima]|uniref:membrane metallo-endopeptidase-like 1 n=1 Tax=Musca vetustissima TaxID=27455 RepID=UPI002AB781C0